jgi:hypothetical protein
VERAISKTSYFVLEIAFFIFEEQEDENPALKYLKPFLVKYSDEFDKKIIILLKSKRFYF